MSSVTSSNVMKGDIDDMHLVCADYLERKAVKLGLEKLFLLTTRTADWSAVHLFCSFAPLHHKLGILSCPGLLYDMLRLFAPGLYNGDLRNVSSMHFHKRGRPESIFHGALNII